MLEECCLCPRHCGVDRLAGESGKCHITNQVMVSSYTYLNIMAKYRPCYKAFDILLLSRPMNTQEFREAIDLAHQQGVDRLDRYNSLQLRFIPG